MGESEPRFESVIDRQIRLAAERGEFDNLPGAGKPLPNWGGQDDELWWIKDYVRREGLTSEAMLPTSLQLARDIERLPEQVRALLSEQVVREQVAALNKRIAVYKHSPSPPFVSVRPVDAETAVAHWRAAYQAIVEQPDDHGDAPAPRPRVKWRRVFGRRG